MEGSKRRLAGVLALGLGLLGCGGEKAGTASGARGVAVETACSDGADNDRDGHADCDDLDCRVAGGNCVLAPPLDRSVATTLGEASAFLYTGPDPLQRGADPKAFDARRAAIVRGKVVGVDGASLAGVRVSVVGHSEYGFTLTRGDGLFNLAVNGGGRLVLRYERSGFLTAERTSTPGWQRWAHLPEVGLVPRSENRSHVAVDSSKAQVALGDAVTDESGERQPLVFFEPGTEVTATLASGKKQALEELTLGITEYPFEPSTADDFVTTARFAPGTLPVTAGLHYGLEIGVAEAEELGATRVSLSKPALIYLENFLRLPAGAPVPLGFYDPKTAQWQGATGGRVVRVLDVRGGEAVLDLDGDGAPDSVEALAKAHVTSDELLALGDRYEDGDTLWRVSVSHFSSWNMLFPLEAPGGAIAPSLQNPFSRSLDVPTRRGASVVERQASSRSVPLTGTPFSLHYQSDRTTGYGFGFQFELPLVPDDVPAGLERVLTSVQIAGRELGGRDDAKAGLKRTIVWDGKDAFGRLLQGPQSAHVVIRYVYAGEIALSDDFGVAGPPLSETEAEGIDAGDAFVTREFDRPLGVWDAKGYELGGFSIDALHAYSPATQSVFFGWGDERTAQNIALVVTRPGKAFDLGTPDSIGVAPDGSIFVSDDEQGELGQPGHVFRIDREGNATVIAGEGANGEAGELELSSPQGVVVRDDGSVLVADLDADAVREIRTDGSVRTLLGPALDEPVVSSDFTHVDGIALGPREELYVVDADRVLRLEGGKLSVLAGGGTASGSAADGGPATEAALVAPSAVAAAPDGTVFISERGTDDAAAGGNRVRQVSPSGIITTLAGTGSPGFSGDGGNAQLAELDGPRGLALAQDGSLFVADQENDRIRRITPDGIIQTVVGGGDATLDEGQLAEKVALDRPDGIAVDRDGVLYVAAGSSVFRVAPGMPEVSEKEALIPSTDGTTLFRFDQRGRHEATIDAMTGVTELALGYDDEGRLKSLRDKNGLTTTIERSSSGKLRAFVGPFGQRTKVGLDERGAITTVEDPLGRETTFRYDDAGLLGTMVDPAGLEHGLEYGPLGLLAKVSDPTGYFESFAASEAGGKRSVEVTTPAGRSMGYDLEFLGGGTLRRKIRFPDGTVVQSDDVLVSQATKSTDGSTLITKFDPDDAFGAQALFPGEITLKTPSGKTLTALAGRDKVVTDIDNRLSVEEWIERSEVNGREHRSRYVAKDRSITRTTPGGRSSTTTLDELGRPVRFEGKGLPLVELTYDGLGRVVATKARADGDSREQSFSYGEDGYFRSSKDSASNELTYGRDLVGRITSLLRPDGSSVEAAYDSTDNLLSLTPPGRGPHQFSYRGDTHLLELSSPPDVGGGTDSSLAAGQTRYEYTPDLDLARVLRSDGRNVDFTYDDASGRVKRVALASASVTLGYDEGGVLTSASRSDGAKVTVTHDGPLWTGSTWSGAIEGSVTGRYDDDFRLSQITVNGASTAKFTYDADSLVTSATANSTTLELTRDPSTGFVADTTLGEVSTTNAYSGFGELAKLSARFQDTTGFSQILKRDSLGRITGLEETFGTNKRVISYAYDDIGRLVQAQRDGVVTTYSYDANGNRTREDVDGEDSFDGEYDAQDRIQRLGELSFEQTAQGDLLRVSDDETALELAYDELGNLRTATLSDDSTSFDIEYVMDGLGRRVARRTNGDFDKAWLYLDGLRPAAEIDSDGTFMHFLYAGGGAGAPDFILRAGVPLRVIKDHLGSVRLVVNATSGVVEQKLDYDEFGRVLEDSRPGFQPFGFAGGLYDPQTGLVRFGARDYAPMIGRWVAKDPSGFAGGDTNLYAYCGNDPVNFVDLDGLEPKKKTFGDYAHDVIEVLVVDPLECVIGSDCTPVQAAAYIATGMAAGRVLRMAARLLVPAAVPVASSVVKPLVYGPSAGGKLVKLAERLGGETLTSPSLQKPMELTWEVFSKQTLDSAAASGRRVIFDLTHMEDVPGVLNGTGRWAQSVTGAELRYLQANWARFQGNVTFYLNGAPTSVPW